MNKKAISFFAISVFLGILPGCQTGGEVSQMVTIPPELPEAISTQVRDNVALEITNDNVLIQNLKKQFSGLADEQIKNLQIISGVLFDGTNSKMIRVQFFYDVNQNQFSYALDEGKATQIVAFVIAEIKKRLEKKLIEQGYTKSIGHIISLPVTSSFGMRSR